MRKILTSRLFRCLICLILVCSLLVLSSPIRAQADIVSGGLIAAGATGAVVSVPVAIAVGATLICLGVMADAVSQNPFALQQVASEIEQHLTAAGTFVKDGMVEMYRFVTETGEAVYYAAADFMECCRSYLFDSQVIATKGIVANPNVEVPADALAVALAAPHAFFSYTVTVGGTNAGYYSFVLCYSYASPIKVSISNSEGNGYYISTEVSKAPIFVFGATGWKQSSGVAYSQNTSKRLVDPCFIGTSDPAEFVTDYAVTLGALLNVPIDGTSARTWSEAYANRGLYIASGGSQNPDDGSEGNGGWKFLLPLSLLAGADLWAMSQADQWTGSTPPEFGDYSTKEELTVTPAPEFEGYPSIEIAPLPNPNPDPGEGSDPTTSTEPDATEVPDPGGNPGVNPNPGTGTDPGTNANPDPDPDPNPDPDPSPEPDPEPGTNSGSGSWTPPSDMGKFTLDLKQYFPFCIPFDLYAFFTCLNAEPVAPVIEWIIPLPGGKTYPFEIDLSAFDSVAQILRRMQLLLFCVGLAFKTRDLIKG